MSSSPIPGTPDQSILYRQFVTSANLPTKGQMIDFSVPSTWHPKPTQKSTQEIPKIDEKGVENMMQVGFEVGPLLGRILVDFGAKLGGNLDPSWHQNPEKMGPKTMSKIIHKNHSKKNPCEPASRNLPERTWSLVGSLK